MGGKVLELESERLLRMGKEEGMAEGREEGKIEAIQKMIRNGCTEEFILGLDYTEEDYTKAELGLHQNV